MTKDQTSQEWKVKMCTCCSDLVCPIHTSQDWENWFLTEMGRFIEHREAFRQLSDVDYDDLKTFIKSLLAKEKETAYQEGQKDAMNGISPPLEQKIKGLLETARREERERVIKMMDKHLESIFSYYSNADGKEPIRREVATYFQALTHPSKEEVITVFDYSAKGSVEEVNENIYGEEEKE